MTKAFNTIGLRCGMNAHAVSALGEVAHLAVFTLALGLGWTFVVHRHQWLSRAAVLGLQHPVWMAVALASGLQSLYLMNTHAMGWPVAVWPWLEAAPQFGAGPTDTLTKWGLWSWVVRNLFWVCTIPLLADYLWKRPSTLPRRLPVKTLESLDPGDRAQVPRLQAQGLSLKESLMVFAWRRDGRAACFEANELPVRRVWLERGFWMIVGMMAGRLAVQIALNESWMVLCANRSPSPLVQHLAGLASVWLPLALSAAITAALWARITRSQEGSSWIGRLCRQHPVRCAVVFAWCVSLGLAFAPSLNSVACSVRANSAGAGVAYNWSRYYSVLATGFIPVALLVWAARRYDAERSAPERGHRAEAGQQG